MTLTQSTLILSTIHLVRPIPPPRSRSSSHHVPMRRFHHELPLESPRRSALLSIIYAYRLHPPPCPPLRRPERGAALLRSMSHVASRIGTRDLESCGSTGQRTAARGEWISNLSRLLASRPMMPPHEPGITDLLLWQLEDHTTEHKLTYGDFFYNFLDHLPAYVFYRLVLLQNGVQSSCS